MELLYQDAQIAVCIKPQGVLSEAGPGSLPGLLQDALGGSIYPVHRLDRNVGGVMVYARTKAAAAALSRAIQDGGMAKEYLALIPGQQQGALPQGGEGLVGRCHHQIGGGEVVISQERQMGPVGSVHHQHPAPPVH